MESYGLTFHHLGLAVKRVEPAVKFLSGLGYGFGRRVRDELQNVNLVMASRERMPAVEIIWPTETPGPVSDILRFSNEMIYHTCYETGDVDASLAAIRGDRHNIICVSPPKPAVLFSGRRVSFYYIRDFGMLELLEAAGSGSV